MICRTIRNSLLNGSRIPKPRCNPSRRIQTALLSTQPNPAKRQSTLKPFAIKASSIPGSSPSHPRDIAKAKPQDRARILPSYEDLRTQTYSPAPSIPPSPETYPLDPSVAQLLPQLKSQPPHYCTIHIHGRPYLVTPGDTIRLPFYMHDVELGDVLRLNRASLLGSRDYTLKAGASVKGEKQRFLDERLFVCRARVTGHTQEPLRVTYKTKRRRRHIKRTYSKHKYTVLTVTEVTVNDAPVD